VGAVEAEGAAEKRARAEERAARRVAERKAVEEARAEERARDGTLMAGVKGGDLAAMRALYERFGKVIWATAMKVLRDEEDATEVAQEALANVWRGAGRFDAAKGRLITWVLSITRNAAIDRLRQRGSRERTEEEAARDAEVLERGGTVDGGDGPPPDAGEEARARARAAAPADGLAERELRERVQRAIWRLDKEQRLVMHLAYWEGLTRPEIAARLGWGEGRVKWIAERAEAALAGALQGAEQGA
jgi:RNA polymerase sigma-70 factor (ECF subfamily)